MHFAIPTADYPPIEGGISTLTLNLARELCAQEHGVDVVAPHFPDMQDFDDREPYAVKRYRGYDLGWLRYVPMRAAAKPVILSADCTIAINVAYAGMMAHAAKRPYVALAYGYEFLKHQNVAWMRARLRKVYNESLCVVAISHFTAERLAHFGVDPDRIVVIHPGAEPAQTAPDEASSEVARIVEPFDPVVLAVGRFVPRKGHETLIRAFPEVLAANPDAGLVLIGQGPRLNAAQALTRELGIADQVVFRGRCSDDERAAWYAQCDLFALPTGQQDDAHVEGFGLVFAEAHAYGKAVVGGRSGGVVDAVLHEETGLLVDPDSPDETALATNRLLANSEIREAFGRQGRRRVENELNWTLFTRRLVDEVSARIE